MESMYNKILAEYKHKKSLIAEIRKFRCDKRTCKYMHTRTELGLNELNYRNDVRTLNELIELAEQGSKIQEIKKDKTKNFDSCSYSEITSCIIARIHWIREYIHLLYNKELHREYPSIMKLVHTKIDNAKKDIGILLKMRRELKRSKLKNWDSSVLSI